MQVARKIRETSQFEYEQLGMPSGGGTVTVKEDSSMVDGIGGVLWDGTLVLNRFLECLLPALRPKDKAGLHVVELGCGAGLSSVLLSSLSDKYGEDLKLRITATDRHSDLAAANCPRDVIRVVDLDWSDTRASEDLVATHGQVDMIIGSEIVVLNKQQRHLASTIATLSSPQTLVFLTVDDESKYESEFILAMNEQGFTRCYTVASGSIHWADGDVAHLYDFKTYSLGGLLPLCVGGAAGGAGQRRPAGAEAEAHRVLLFHQPGALRTCSSCHRPFLSSAFDAFNPPDRCRFHPLLFVQRLHPAETRLDCGFGDGEGYYGGGQEGYEAKFWDCCGEEAQKAQGCKHRRCSGY